MIFVSDNLRKEYFFEYWIIISTMSKLTKPTFVKVNTLVDSRNGYNVYVRVVSAEETKSQDGQTSFVRAVVAD